MTQIISLFVTYVLVLSVLFYFFSIDVCVYYNHLIDIFEPYFFLKR